MEHFPIRSFRPNESKTENTDQDRTVMRLCDGFLAHPIGALSAGPEWKSLWGLSDLQTQIESALSAADGSKAHFVTVTRGNHVFVIVWSKSLDAPVGCFHVTAGAPADFDFDSTTSVTITATNNATWRDKNGAAPWFPSRIADRWYFGNGIDDNVQWSSGALSLLGPASAPAASALYNNSRVKFPACTSFVMAGNKSIFGAGNAATPKRVWIAHPPTSDYPFNEGIYSLSTSFIDLNYTEATKITALSAFQNYITAHTDAKPVNLYDVDGSNDGWKCVQAPGAANSSAPCPAAVRDTNGLSAFYVGTDGEIYEDQAIRVGPHDKRSARDQDIATKLGSGIWNLNMKKPVTSGDVHTVYDRTQQLFWVWAELEGFSGRFGLWTFNERNRAVSGPFTHINALVSAAIGGNAEGAAQYTAIITAGGQFLYADLSNVGETDEFLNEDSAMPLMPEFAELTVAPTPTPGLGYVAVSANGKTFKEVIAGGDNAIMADPWSMLETQGDYTFTRFYKDAYLARFETGFEDFGDAQLRKDYLELRMTWQKHSRAYVGFYAETEEGRRSGRWKGLVFNRETHAIPLTLSGRRIRIRGVVVLFNAGPAMLRDVSIGWAPAGTT